MFIYEQIAKMSFVYQLLWTSGKLLNR